MTILLALLHILLIAGLAFLLWRKQNLFLRRVFWPALIVKLIAGVVLGLLYRYYFPVGDTFVYFNDALQVANLARDNTGSYVELLFLDYHVETLGLTFQEPRALFLTKVISLVNLLTRDNYWISGLYFSFLSFVGAFYLVQVLATYIPSVRHAAVIAFLFFPSIVFWTSGLLKESLAMPALFCLAALILKLWFDRKIAGWLYLVAGISLILLWNLKYYYAGVFIPVAFTSLCYRFFVESRIKGPVIMRALIWCGIFVLPLIAVSLLHPNFNVDRILGVIVSNNAAYNNFSDPGDFIYFRNLSPTPLSILSNTPWALFSGLFRPLPWEAKTIVQVVAGIENIVLLILFVAALLRVGRVVDSPHRQLAGSLIVLVFLLCVFITISAPNFGTLSRYRVGYLGFFVFLVFCDNPAVRFLERSFWRLVRD